MVIPHDVEKRLDSINKLPTLPTVIENLGHALRDPEIQASRIAEIIEDDPAIMARIMKVVNSSFYLGSEKAGSLKSAIVRLGFQAVSNIAMSAAVFSTFPPGSKTRFNRVEFWRHCICTGVAADIVHHAMPESSGSRILLSRDRLHLCGLLHDIGKIIFEQFFHDQFVSAIHISQRENIFLADAEKRVIGIDHAQAGAWLAKKWNLSESLIEVIRWHHEPERTSMDYRYLVNICRLADLLVNASHLGDGGNNLCLDMNDTCREFDLEAEQLVSLVDSVKAGAQNSTLLISFLQ